MVWNYENLRKSTNQVLLDSVSLTYTLASRLGQIRGKTYTIQFYLWVAMDSISFFMLVVCAVQVHPYVELFTNTDTDTNTDRSKSKYFWFVQVKIFGR